MTRLTIVFGVFAVLFAGATVGAVSALLAGDGAVTECAGPDISRAALANKETDDV